MVATAKKTAKPTRTAKVAEAKARVNKAIEKATTPKGTEKAAAKVAAATAPKVLNDDKIVNIAAPASGPVGTKILETELSKAGGHKDSMKASLVIGPERWTSEVRKLAVLGGSLKAVRKYLAEHKPEAKLAQGVTARLAPNAALASERSRKATTPAAAPNPKAKVGTKGQTQTSKAAPERRPNVTKEPGKRLSGQAYGGKVEDHMTITVVAGSSPYKTGTKADATFALFAKSKTVADFRKLVAKSPDKYDAGYIRYAARDGFITLK